jgi:hypothetical protein
MMGEPTVKIKKQDVRVGDDLWFLGRPYRITRIEPYRHPVVTRGEDARTAYSDGPGRTGRNAWGITLSFEHGYAASAEISVRMGEPPYVVRPPDDDYLCPFDSAAAELFARFQAAGRPGSWREWLALMGSTGELVP